VPIPEHATNHRARRADQAKAAKVIAAQLGGQLAGRRSCASRSHPTNKANVIRHPMPSLLLILASDPARHLPTDPYQNPDPIYHGKAVQGDIRPEPDITTDRSQDRSQKVWNRSFCTARTYSDADPRLDFLVSDSVCLPEAPLLPATLSRRPR